MSCRWSLSARCSVKLDSHGRDRSRGTTAGITAEPPPNHRGTTAEPVAWKSSAVVLGKNKHVHSFRGRPRNFSTRLVPRWFGGGSAVVRRWFGGDSRGRSAGTISSVWALSWIHTDEIVPARTTARILHARTTAEPPHANHRATHRATRSLGKVSWTSSERMDVFILSEDDRRTFPRDWLRGGCAVVRRWFGGDSRGRSRGNDRVRVNPALIQLYTLAVCWCRPLLLCCRAL